MTKIDNSLSEINLICPLCEEETTALATPIQKIYDQINDLNLYCSSKNVEDFTQWFTLIKPIPHNPSGIIYHTKLWACNNCVSEGKAIMGNFKIQVYSLGGPTYMYVDINYECRECKCSFTFSAAEQKHWYEDLGFLVDARPVNCLECRKKIRHIKNGAKRLGELNHLSRKFTKEELEEMSAIYELMGSEKKAETAANRAKKMY